MIDALLALDLGTTTGFCVGTSRNQVHGPWDLRGRRHDGGGMRFVQFRTRLREIHEAYGTLLVVYEEVMQRHSSSSAADVYGGLLSILQTWCEDNAIPYEGVPVGTIKKYWTGRGNASKDEMIQSCVERGVKVGDHNEADAVALFFLKLQEYGAEIG